MVEDIVTLRSLNARLEEEKQNLINSSSRKQTIIYKQEQQLHEQNLTIENLKKEKEHLELQIKQITLQHRKQIKNILTSAKSTEHKLQSSLLDVSEKATKRIEELEQQIEKMKCCGNCEFDETCLHHACDKDFSGWKLKEQ